MALLAALFASSARAQFTVVDAGTSQVFTSTASATTFAWALDGTSVGGTASTYTYTPDTNGVGTHELAVAESHADGTTTHTYWGVRVRIPVPASTVMLYVSPSGSDSNGGTSGAPFQTLARAEAAVHALQPLPAGGVTIYLRAGTYYLSSTATFSESGTANAPIIWTSYPGETAILSAGTPLPSSAFVPLSSTVTSRVAPGVDATRIWEADLTSLGLKHIGPFPAVFNEWQQYNSLNPGPSGGIFDVYYNGARAWLSRYPNHDLTNESATPMMLMNGVAQDAAGNYLNASGTYTDSNGVQVPVGGAFHYNTSDAAHVARWSTALANGGVWAMGYWRVPWQIDGEQVIGIDTKNQVLEIAPSATPQGGFGSKYSRPAGSKAEPFWAANLLEEIDQPGEWAIDFARKKFYFMMDAAGAPADGSVVITDLGTPMISVTGNYNIIQSLTFEDNLAQAVQILNGNRNLVLGCTFQNVGNMAVDINGGTYNGVVSCDLTELAAGGVILRGGSETSPRVPANNFAVNNSITSFGRLTRVYEGSVDCGFGGPLGSGGGGGSKAAVGMRVAHNTASGTPHGGIFQGSFDTVFEYNDISNFCQFSNDIGAIYSYTTATNSANQTFRYNFIHDSAIGDALYFDGDHLGYHLYGNISCLRTASTASQGYGFWYKPGDQATTNAVETVECYNNLSIGDRYSFTFVAAKPSVIQNNAAINYLTTPFSWSLVSSTSGSVTITSSTAAALQSGPNDSYTSDPGFLGLATNDARLMPTSRIYTDMPGFQPIPVELMGLYNDEYRTNAPGHTPYVSTGPPVATQRAGAVTGTLVFPQFDGNTSVTVYWGTSDSGTTTSGWAHATNLGVQPSGVVTATLTGLTAGTTYYYRYDATNPYGTALASTSGSLTPPAAPTALVATSATGSVTLSWHASSLAQGYSVLRSTTTGTGYVALATTTGTSYVDTAVTAGATYYYVVAAQSSSGLSANSNEASGLAYTPFEQWLVSNGLSATTSGSSTPDNDGVSVLLKYATGLPLGVTSVAGPATVSASGDHLVITFNRVTPAPVNYFVETSSDLVNWSSLASLAASGTGWTGTGSVAETGTGPVAVAVTDTASLSGGTGPRFLRLRVTGTDGTTEPGSLPAGDLPVTLAGAATTMFSLPLDNVPVGRATVQAVATSTLTVVNAGNWAATGSPYALRLLSGNGAGRTWQITAQNGNALGLATAGVDLTQFVAVGDRYEVLPVDTVTGLFGTTNGLLAPGVGPTLADNLLVWNGTTWLTYYFNGTNWKQSGSLLLQNNLVMPVGGGLSVTRRVASAEKFEVIGRVPEVGLNQFTTPGAYTFLSAAYPLPVTLSASGFASASGWLAGPGPTVSDNLLVWNGTTWLTFYYTGSQWRQSGSLLSQTSFTLAPGTPVFVYRHSTPSLLNSFIAAPLTYTP